MDDLLITRSSITEIEQFKNRLNDAFEMTYLGCLTIFWNGIRVHISRYYST